MGSYTIHNAASPQELGVYSKSLVADTVDTVTFDTPPGVIRVITDASADVSVTFDGSTPVVDANATYTIPAGERNLEVAGSAVASSTVVKLLSHGTPKYSVTGAGGSLS